MLFNVKSVVEISADLSEILKKIHTILWLMNSIMAEKIVKLSC